MDNDNLLLIEKLAEYAERNRFTLEELERLIRLCLQLERDCPGVQFVIPGGNARSIEQELLLQAQASKQLNLSPENFDGRFNQARA
ncbi:MAG: hypothetical protein FIB02_12885 [Desulfuromonas sp.]|nr:hypothetical protein [Desulfuromonas sp.]